MSNRIDRALDVFQRAMSLENRERVTERMLDAMGVGSNSQLSGCTLGELRPLLIPMGKAERKTIVDNLAAYVALREQSASSAPSGNLALV